MSHSSPSASMHEPALTSLSDSDASTVPWYQPSVLPVIPVDPQWRVLRGSGLEVVDEPQLHAALRKETAKTSLKTRLNSDLKAAPPQDDLVSFVVPPLVDRMLPAVECPELHADILQRDENMLRHTRVSQGKLFVAMLGLLLLLFMLKAGGLLLLAFIYMGDSGYNYFAAHQQLRQLQRTPADYLAARGADLRYALWLRQNGQAGVARRLVLAVTWGLIAVLQIYVKGLHQSPADIQAAGLVKALVWDEPWRLLTAAMLHGGLIHLLVNLASLMSLGLIMERSVHRSLVVPVWLAGALGGSVFSWCLLDATSIGASGGLMGMFGFLLAMGWQRRTVLPPDFFRNLVRGLGLMTLIGIVAWEIIDNAAHAGGLLTGAVFGWLVFRRADASLPLKPSKWLNLGGMVADGLFLAVALLTVYLMLK